MDTQKLVQLHTLLCEFIDAVQHDRIGDLYGVPHTIGSAETLKRRVEHVICLRDDEVKVVDRPFDQFDLDEFDGADPSILAALNGEVDEVY